MYSTFKATACSGYMLPCVYITAKLQVSVIYIIVMIIILLYSEPSVEQEKPKFRGNVVQFCPYSKN